MPDKKLTDWMIKKALECCIISDCPNCPMGHRATGTYNEHCGTDLMKNALDLINRKDAENERLKPFKDKIAGFNSHIRVEDMLVFANSLEEWLEFCDNLKAEAYKEFAERFIMALVDTYDLKSIQITNIEKIKNNLLKELVGEDK